MEDPTYTETVKVTTKETKRFNSRKFLLSVGIWTVGTIGWLTGMMTADQWIEFSRWILTLYLVGNVSESALEYLRK